MRSCRLRNLASWLSARERGCITQPQPFSEAPEQLQIPVDSIIDEHEHLKGAVVLGWTHSGSCLISYTSSPVPAADGKEGHHVQLWRFDPFQRIARLCNLPVFDSLSAPWGAGTGDAAASLLVTVWAAPDDSLLVVHGAPTDVIDPSEDLLMCPVTVISGLELCDGDLALQTAHFEYCPQQRGHAMQPALQLSPLGTLVLAESHGVGCIQFAVERYADIYVPHGLRSIGTAKCSHMFSVFLELSRPDIVKGEVGLAPYDDKGFCTEPFLQEWMLGNLPGHQLYDYDLQFVVLLPPADLPGPAQPAGTAADEYDFIETEYEDDDRVDYRSGAFGSLIVLIAAAARRLSAAGMLHPPGEATRMVCLLVDIDLATGKGEVLSVAEATPQQQQQQQQQQQVVASIAAAHAAGWRRRFASPQDVRRLPSVLSNASVLATGRSVEQLRHPWLPMCLKGYKAAPQHPP